MNCVILFRCLCCSLSEFLYATVPLHDVSDRWLADVAMRYSYCS